jgi:hypothetical protein
MELNDIFAQGITAPRPIRIRIVDDEQCPACGRTGRPKVYDEDGTAHWKCPSTYDECKVAYYVPGTRRIEYKLTPEKDREMAARIKADIDALMERSRWVSRGNSSKCIPKDAPLPAGWTEGTGDF